MSRADAERGVLAMLWLLTVYAQKWIMGADATLAELEKANGQT